MATFSVFYGRLVAHPLKTLEEDIGVFEWDSINKVGRYVARNMIFFQWASSFCKAV
jgi:hypothetical protein